MNERDRLRLRHILDIPWNKASGIRNRLVHGYFDVDLKVVWRTARDSLPAFARQISSLLQRDRQ